MNKLYIEISAAKKLKCINKKFLKKYFKIIYFYEINIDKMHG